MKKQKQTKFNYAVMCATSKVFNCMKDHCTMFPICQIKNYRQQGKSIDADRVSCSSADKIIQKWIEELKEEIDKLIDHYTPYRPITDSKEMQEVRKVLEELKYRLGEDK